MIDRFIRRGLTSAKQMFFVHGLRGEGEPYSHQ